MNSNKALILLSCFLALLVVISAITRSRGNRYKYISTDNELFLTNVHCIPDIVRSYDSVKNIYGRKNTLFFRYISTSCSSCTNSHLAEILTIQEEIGKDHIWIFPAYSNDRKSRIILKTDLAEFNYRNIPSDSLLIPEYGGEKKSYFAWINNEGEIGMVFLPDKNNVLQTRRYFLEIKELIKEAKDIIKEQNDSIPDKSKS